jgi:hypothetical protein
LELADVARDVLAALKLVDASPEPFRHYQRGVGPYGEPQLVKLICEYLNSLPTYTGRVRTRKTPDLLIADSWAIEFKITRPFGDNGREAENWSVNLLHPYPGNVSTVGDCLKLLELTGPERKAIIVIGYEHEPPVIDLTPLIRSFEVVAREIYSIELSRRVDLRAGGLVHPVHQAVRVLAWEVLRTSA